MSCVSAYYRIDMVSFSILLIHSCLSFVVLQTFILDIRILRNSRFILRLKIKFDMCTHLFQIIKFNMCTHIFQIIIYTNLLAEFLYRQKFVRLILFSKTKLKYNTKLMKIIRWRCFNSTMNLPFINVPCSPVFLPFLFTITVMLSKAPVPLDRGEVAV